VIANEDHQSSYEPDVLFRAFEGADDSERIVAPKFLGYSVDPVQGPAMCLRCLIK